MVGSQMVTRRQSSGVIASLARTINLGEASANSRRARTGAPRSGLRDRPDPIVAVEPIARAFPAIRTGAALLLVGLCALSCGRGQAGGSGGATGVGGSSTGGGPGLGGGSGATGGASG